MPTTPPIDPGENWKPVGRLPKGTKVKWGRNTVEMVVHDLWQDEVEVRSTKSGRTYTWQDTEFVLVVE
jgi:hypothetical protein